MVPGRHERVDVALAGLDLRVGSFGGVRWFQVAFLGFSSLRDRPRPSYAFAPSDRVPGTPFQEKNKSIEEGGGKARRKGE